MIWLLGGGVAVYGAFVGGLYFMQDSMIFPRHHTSEPQYPLPPRTMELQLETADGETLRGHLHQPEGESKGLLIGFSGNAWNSSDCLGFIAKRVPGWHIAVFHYRGYTPSSGEPSEAALFADALHIHDFLKNDLSPKKTIGIGFSLGSGVVSYLASKRGLDGQVLFTPFDSIAEIAKQRYRFVPVNSLIKHPFRSIEHQASVAIPTSVVLASHDRVVPRDSSDRLIAGLSNLKYMEEIPNSTHGGIYDMAEVDEVLRRAIEKAGGADG